MKNNRINQRTNADTEHYPESDCPIKQRLRDEAFQKQYNRIRSSGYWKPNSRRNKVPPEVKQRAFEIFGKGFKSKNEVAAQLGVSKDTITKWLKEY